MEHWAQMGPEVTFNKKRSEINKNQEKSIKKICYREMHL